MPAALRIVAHHAACFHPRRVPPMVAKSNWLVQVWPPHRNRTRTPAGFGYQ